MTTINLLNQLHELRTRKQESQVSMQAAIDAVYTPEIRSQIDDIAKQFNTDELDASISNVERQVKKAVIKKGATISGEKLQAIFMKGRVSWDTGALEGVIALHPELAKFKKIGNPSCSIRKRKDG